MPNELTIREPNMMELLSMAVDKGAGIETIERLAKLQREMVEYQSKVEWNDAMQRCQAKMKPISKDAVNPQTHSKYATYEKLDRALRPIYSEEGFSLSFNTADSPKPDHIRVLCDVARGGHIRPYQIDIPVDGKGPKGNDVMSKTHAAGSGASYGMRYLLKMIFNVILGDKDDDGNAAAGLSLQAYAPLVEAIEQAQTVAEVTKAYIAAIKSAGVIGDRESIGNFERAANKRKGELSR